jgi:mannose-6-phosphate isomerase-like protein (cupin superfamily)
MEILHTDAVVGVRPGESPDYDHKNPVSKLTGLIESQSLAAERESYVSGKLQYLFPIKSLTLYGPSGGDAGILDPTQQDNKTDFQKQNVNDFITSETRLVRGLVRIAGATFPFLRLSYVGGPFSTLATAAGGRLGPRIKLYLEVGGTKAGQLISVPYNESSDRYEVELWGWRGTEDNLRAALATKGRAALDSGELILRPDLIQGTGDDFARDKVDGLNIAEVATTHTLHPILPLRVILGWANNEETAWDSNNGANHHYEFSMILRGWESFLGVGTSPNPHGGVGFLEYRNLMSNYGRYQGLHEVGRTIPPWSFDAFGHKAPGERREEFFAVDYMDLHIVKPNCAIGLHRHRDNQEVFLVMEGRALMVVGDWCLLPNRERCLEVRTLEAGHFAMLKGGNLHSLINPTDTNLSLFMFGGYD